MATSVKPAFYEFKQKKNNNREFAIAPYDLFRVCALETALHAWPLLLDVKEKRNRCKI